jgi:hypothetical protein
MKLPSGQLALVAEDKITGYFLNAAHRFGASKARITDAVMVLLHLFLGGAALPEPFGACGADPSADDLTCASFAGCP